MSQFGPLTAAERERANSLYERQLSAMCRVMDSILNPPSREDKALDRLAQDIESHPGHEDRYDIIDQ